MKLSQRPRRLRRSAGIRNLVAETLLAPEQLVWPVFLTEGNGAAEPIAALPGVVRYSEETLLPALREARELGIAAVALFPKISAAKKDAQASEALRADGLIPTTIRRVKKEFPDLILVSDVALDPFSSAGHDGVVENGEVLNDPSVDILARMALLHAQAGADFVAPSDMMDGRVGAIRKLLDANGCQQTGILSYAVKYASSFYGPFRAALDSAPRAGDKKTYQMDPRNVREALREAKLDEEEGADILMVKPAGAYLDVIRAVHEATPLPVAAYQVSGEYAMLQFAARAGVLDLEAGMVESLTAIHRAGADIIFTYFAVEMARWLRKN